MFLAKTYKNFMLCLNYIGFSCGPELTNWRRKWADLKQFLFPFTAEYDVYKLAQRDQRDHAELSISGTGRNISLSIT